MSFLPYSTFKVGCSLRVVNQDGHSTIVKGCNIENAAYPLCQCAEASAIGVALSSGYRYIEEVCVVGSGDLLCAPCGGCRQKLREHCKTLDVKVHICTTERVLKTVTINQLLPLSFGPENLLPDMEMKDSECRVLQGDGQLPSE